MMTIDEILENRQTISGKLNETLKEEMAGSGVKLNFVGVKDVMLPGDLKKTYTETLKAKKEALSALEKARGEAAVLRKLANFTDMLENNPYLMQLRILQSMDHSSGNTFVVDLQQTKKDLAKIVKRKNQKDKSENNE